MKPKYLITEGVADEKILRKILPGALLNGIKIIPAGGYSSALAWASSLLNATDETVIVVIDADSNDRQIIDERLGFLQAMLSQTASKDRFSIIMFEPGLETIFFQNQEVAEHLFGGYLTEIDARLAATSPKEALKILGANTSEVLQKLDAKDIGKLRTIPQISRMIKLLNSNGLSSDVKAA